MRKLLPSIIKRREEARKNREACRKWVEEGMSRLSAVRCKTPRDPYSDERDYELVEASESDCIRNEAEEGAST